MGVLLREVATVLRPEAATVLRPEAATVLLEEVGSARPAAPSLLPGTVLRAIDLRPREEGAPAARSPSAASGSSCSAVPVWASCNTKRARG